MPVHDWPRVAAGIFHDFHHAWIEENKRALNQRLKGTDYYALAEQVAGGWGPDVLTLQGPQAGGERAAPPAVSPPGGGVVALATSPPKLRYRITDENKWYAGKKKAVTIRHVSEHKLVAVLEVMSPGNKASRGELDDFVRKAHQLLTAGINFALVDLFPPTRRDPEGIHRVLWGDDEVFQFDPAKPLTCASCRAGPTEALVEPVGLGDTLPDLPVFLLGDEHVPVPLEATYEAAFAAVPDFWRAALTNTTQRDEA